MLGTEKLDFLWVRTETDCLSGCSSFQTEAFSLNKKGLRKLLKSFILCFRPCHLHIKSEFFYLPSSLWCGNQLINNSPVGSWNFIHKQLSFSVEQNYLLNTVPHPIREMIALFSFQKCV